jgi:SAM-dependent methyltransferase
VIAPRPAPLAATNTDLLVVVDAEGAPVLTVPEQDAPLPYPDAYNPDLLDRIPLDARTILDVGCGAGSLLAAYRRLNPRARLLGIERHAQAARIAARRLDTIAAIDVEANPVPFSATGPIDCVIHGDVLEHLRDPWPVVQRHIRMLSDDGTVLICVPNVEHWSFVAKLLLGTWDYEPTGLFDVTHLRWFSLESMRRQLEALGLSPCDVHPRIFDAERAEAFGEILAPALAALGVDARSYTDRSAPLQYIWRARKHPRRLMAIAGNMLKPIGGVSHVRVLHPLRALATDPTVSVHVAAAGGVPAIGPGVPKIYLLHRPILTGSQGLKILETLIADGWLVVTEFDDHPDFFEDMKATDQYAFRGVHAVQTSTPTLASILRARNPEIAIFPNAVRKLPDARNFRDPATLTLFFGALNRQQDWAPFIPALNAVAKVAGGRLNFMVVHDLAFFDALDTPQKHFVPTCDYDTYLDLLGKSEICFMPLADTEFNSAKSDLKYIEAAAARAVPLASHTVYSASIEDSRTGILFRNAEELRDRLLRLVAMPALARSIADAARTYVSENRMLAYQTAERIAWYRSRWTRREELTRALLTRMPELEHAALTHARTAVRES